MTPRMQGFLLEAAEASPGKGIIVNRWNSRIAAKAVSDGYGWMITAPLKIFMLDEKAREILAAEDTGQ